MRRRIGTRRRQAVLKWSFLILAAVMLCGAFAAIPFIASALPAFSPRAANGGEASAAPAFALSGGRRRCIEESAVPPEETTEPENESFEASEAPVKGEGDLPVFARNLCWYDDPAKAALNIINKTGYTITPAKYAAEEFPFTGKVTDEPLVLVMHTHGSESYLPSGADFYAKGETFRSETPDCTVVHIGDILCGKLEQAGIATVHDRTMYDLTDFNKSYNYSREGIKAILKEYPSIKFVIDLHRDSIFDSNGDNTKPVTEINGKTCAQIMLVVGTDEGGADHPQWKRNMVVATHLQVILNELFPTLARPINVRSSAFNQALTNGSLLLECGACGNTVEEAENAIALFAEAYIKLIKTEYVQ